jgi:hypothetical protein
MIREAEAAQEMGALELEHWYAERWDGDFESLLEVARARCPRVGGSPLPTESHGDDDGAVET